MFSKFSKLKKYYLGLSHLETQTTDHNKWISYPQIPYYFNISRCQSDQISLSKVQFLTLVSFSNIALREKEGKKSPLKSLSFNKLLMKTQEEHLVICTNVNQR